jgi:hypothetical protein
MSRSGLSTAPDEITDARVRRSRLLRRMYIGGVAAFLVLGMLNVFGSRTSSVEASRNGYSLQVVYPSATRSSLPVEWRLIVTRIGGFTDPVRIGVPLDYWNMFDFNNFYPTPDSTLNQGDMVVLVFPAPAGDRLEVLLDARAQPGLLFGMGATTAVLGNDNRPLVEVSYRTRAMP